MLAWLWLGRRGFCNVLGFVILDIFENGFFLCRAFRHDGFCLCNLFFVLVNFRDYLPLFGKWWYWNVHFGKIWYC